MISDEQCICVTVFDPVNLLKPSHPPSFLCTQLMQALYATDGDYHDELTWAAAWLYKATGKKKFLSEAEKWWAQSTFHNTLEVCWEDLDGVGCGTAGFLREIRLRVEVVQGGCRGACGLQGRLIWSQSLCWSVWPAVAAVQALHTFA